MCIPYRTQHGKSRTNLRFVNTMVASNVAVNKRMEFQQQLLRQKRNHSRHHQDNGSGTSINVNGEEEEEGRLCDDEGSKSSVTKEERSSLKDTDHEDTHRHKSSLGRVYSNRDKH